MTEKLIDTSYKVRPDYLYQAPKPEELRKHWKNDFFNQYELRNQAYQAWRANPSQYANFWNKKSYFDKQPPTKLEVHDWRIYNPEGIWQLEYTKRVLAEKGLKDPWMRNHVWRYPPDIEAHTHPAALWDLVVGKNYRGVKWGLAIFLFSLATDHYRWSRNGGKPEYTTDFIDWFIEFRDKVPNQ